MSTFIEQLQGYPGHIHELVFKDDATFGDYAQIIAAWAIFWHLFVFPIFSRVLQALSYGKPWLRDGVERDYERHKQIFDAMGTTKDEAIDMMMKFWATSQSICAQHVAGAILCIPSVFGSLLGLSYDKSWSSSLACLGMLCAN